ncbi:hypothetical protein [Thermoplasma sp.]|uniref:hypothetical protein n=1 Tax=Thermoplasma sp. TaxID=1973142 RepID=UPI001284CC41|nr:hypothetical protein [Thermoplasma sp.]KAA8923221.1 MAG: hypothetical protein F6Q11_01355 [Thermoplasma sp.]
MEVSILSTMFSNIIAYPLVIFRFLIPALMLFIMVFVVRHYAKRAVPDDYPTDNQKKELFDVPANYINQEYPHVRDNDIDYYLSKVEKDFESVKGLVEEYRYYMKLYRKYTNRLNSPSRRRRKRAKEERDRIFSEIARIYDQLSKMKLDKLILGEDYGSYRGS